MKISNLKKVLGLVLFALVSFVSVVFMFEVFYRVIPQSVAREPNIQLHGVSSHNAAAGKQIAGVLQTLRANSAFVGQKDEGVLLPLLENENNHNEFAYISVGTSCRSIVDEKRNMVLPLLSVAPTSEVTSRVSFFQGLAAMLTFGVSAIFLAFICWLVYTQHKNQKLVHQNRLDLESITANIPGGVVRCQNDENQHITFFAEGFLRMIGYSQQELFMEFGADLSQMLHPDDCVTALADIQRQLQLNSKSEAKYRIVHRKKGYIWVLDTASLVHTARDGECIYRVFMDITDSMEALQEQAINNERYRIIAEQSDGIIFDYNLATGGIYYTSNYETQLGYPPPTENFPDCMIEQNIVYPEDVEHFLQLYRTLEAGESYHELELRIRSADDSYYWFLIRATAIFTSDGLLAKVVGKISNIHNQKQQTLMLKDMAERDSLSGLSNKIATHRGIEACLEQETGEKYHALFLLDIDNFKAVNDNLGHIIGDAVITEVSSKLQRLFRSSDIVGRVGGDEFMIFIKDVYDLQLLYEKAEAILEIFRTTRTGGAGEYAISGSLGIACYPADGVNFAQLYEKADLALYAAKRTGKANYRFYEEGLQAGEQPEAPLQPVPEDMPKC